MDLEGIDQNVIVVDSMSKRYSECGIRIGNIVTRNKDVRESVMKFAQARLSPPLLGQIVAEASIEGTEEYAKECHNEYLARRNFIIAGLNAIPGVYTPMPQGAFYTTAALPVEDVSFMSLIRRRYCRFSSVSSMMPSLSSASWSSPSKV